MRTTALYLILAGLSTSLLQAQDPAVRLARTGDSVSQVLPVRLAAGENGYLLLLRINARGQAAILYPTKATSTSFLAAGEYTLDGLGVGPRAARIRGKGLATIVAVWSRDSLPLGGLVKYGHWMTSEVNRYDFANPASDAVALVQGLGPTGSLTTASLEIAYDTGERYRERQPNTWLSRDLVTDATREQIRRLSLECPAGSSRPAGTNEGCYVE